MQKVIIKSFTIGFFRLPSASVSERVCVQNVSLENKFDQHENRLGGKLIT